MKLDLREFFFLRQNLEFLTFNNVIYYPTIFI